MQRMFWKQLQIPMQSAPPLLGSQSSVGSSTHLPTPGHGVPRNPPQVWTGGHAPVLATLDPADDARQAFEYVLPSHPHTGLKMSGQICGSGAQVPVPAHAPAGFWQKLPAAQSLFEVQAGGAHAPWCATDV